MEQHVDKDKGSSALGLKLRVASDGGDLEDLPSYVNAGIINFLPFGADMIVFLFYIQAFIAYCFTVSAFILMCARYFQHQPAMDFASQAGNTLLALWNAVIVVIIVWSTIKASKKFLQRQYHAASSML